MKVKTRQVPEGIDSSVLRRIEKDVKLALMSVRTKGDSFIINDTVWLSNQEARKSPNPCVVNSAKFITKKFQDKLVELGWEKEKTLKDQRIDGYVEIETGTSCNLTKDRLTKVYESLTARGSEEELDKVFSTLYQMYVKRKCFNINHLPSEVESYFQESSVARSIRIGLEFETGNIASSFRSLSKLYSIYRFNLIDAGVFITSADKGSVAARIWPASNRNGSFEELDKRDYKRNVLFPLWEFSFAPDGVSKDADYLGSNAQLYKILDTGKSEEISGRTYGVFIGEKKRKLLKPKPSNG
ncbi:MAG: hypothetical protein U5R49_17955 [Deltaproteobacteria bacterium]|nr:hypothetical protein [Deltaproteobacteria bacterium]